MPRPTAEEQKIKETGEDAVASAARYGDLFHQSEQLPDLERFRLSVMAETAQALLEHCNRAAANVYKEFRGTA